MSQTKMQYEFQFQRILSTNFYLVQLIEQPILQIPNFNGEIKQTNYLLYTNILLDYTVIAYTL